MNKECIIFYFSGTGNTKWVSDKVSEYLNHGGIFSKAISIESITIDIADKLVTESDLIGFAYPIHASDVPEIMRNFMKYLHRVDNKEAMVFCSQWIFSGDGARTGAVILKNKGFNVRYTDHFFMPNNVCVTIMPLPYTTNEKKINKILIKTKTRIERFTDKILKGEKILRGFNPLSTLLGFLQRGPYRLGYSHMQNDISIDLNNCIDCGQCVNTCPSGNLFYDNGKITSKGNCIMCARCYNFCPVSAVLYMKKPHKINRGLPYRGPYKDLNPTVFKERP